MSYLSINDCEDDSKTEKTRLQAAVESPKHIINVQSLGSLAELCVSLKPVLDQPKNHSTCWTECHLVRKNYDVTSP